MRRVCPVSVVSSSAPPSSMPRKRAGDQIGPGAPRWGRRAAGRGQPGLADLREVLPAVPSLQPARHRPGQRGHRIAGRGGDAKARRGWSRARPRSSGRMGEVEADADHHGGASCGAHRPLSRRMPPSLASLEQDIVGPFELEARRALGHRPQALLTASKAAMPASKRKLRGRGERHGGAQQQAGVEIAALGGPAPPCAAAPDRLRCRPRSTGRPPRPQPRGAALRHWWSRWSRGRRGGSRSAGRGLRWSIGAPVRTATWRRARRPSTRR